VAYVAETVFFAGVNEGGGTWSEDGGGFAGYSDLDRSLRQKEELFVDVMMRWVRHHSGSEDSFVNFEVRSRMRNAVEDGARGVAAVIRMWRHLIEGECDRFDRLIVR
jgi:hypothetical protein